MNPSNESGKCGKCNQTLKSDAEKQEHAKTCGTKETANPAVKKDSPTADVVTPAAVMSPAE